MLSIVLSISFIHDATAKKRPLKLIKQAPMLDTSVLPPRTHFSLQVKHTEILYPADTNKLLHGKAQVVQLHARAQDNVLRGHIAEQAAVPLTPLNTVQHGVKPRFALDIRLMTARLAPTLAHQMEAEIAAARSRMAGDVAVKQELLERELRTKQPRPNMPAVPGRIVAGLDQSHSMESEMEQSKHTSQSAANDAAKQLQTAIASAGEKALGIIQGIGGIGVPKQPRVVAMPSIPNNSSSTSAVVSAQKQMEAELAHAKYIAGTPEQLAAQIESARKQANSKMQIVQPQMDAVLTHLRPLAITPLRATADSAAPAMDVKETIEWDAWHNRFAGLAKAPILKAINERGNPSGKNTVEVTVTRDHRVTARVTQPGGKAFDAAIVAAYQSLSGNRSLEYPPGSKRSEVTFLIDNEHTGSGAPSTVQSQTAVGDREVVHR